MKGKKLSKREMKEDAFVTFAFRALDYVKKERMKFILGGVAVVAVLAIAAYVGSARRSADEDASTQFLAGMLQQRRANYTGAIAAYEDVISRHSGTRSARLALLYMGHARYELGQYEQASEAYQRYLSREKSDRLTRAQAGRGLAACYENTGKYEEAAGLYLEVARGPDAADEIPADLMSAARCWRLGEKPDKAVELLREIVDVYPDYQEVEKAKVLIAELQFGSSQ